MTERYWSAGLDEAAKAKAWDEIAENNAELIRQLEAEKRAEIEEAQRKLAALEQNEVQS